MTIRSTIALAYAVTALALSLGGVSAGGMGQTTTINVALTDRGAIETADIGAHPPLAEIEPELSGHAEDDDLPAYLTTRGDDHADG